MESSCIFSPGVGSYESATVTKTIQLTYQHVSRLRWPKRADQHYADAAMPAD
jgi:hypothetical protein